MTIKERKLILHFLEQLHELLETSEPKKIDPVFLKFFSRKELMDITLWIYTNLDQESIKERSNHELLELIDTDKAMLSYVINRWEQTILAVPLIHQEEVYDFFKRIPLVHHYLIDKPVEQWDEYDMSNYYRMLYKSTLIFF